MSKINRPPLGLQQLLGSQNFGDNPAELASTVQPSIDLFPFYGANILRHEANTGARTAVGDVASFTLDGKVALIGFSLDCYNALTAAETLGTAISIAYISGNASDQKFYVATNLDTYTNPAAPIVLSVMLPNPLVVEEGVMVIGEYWYKSTANSISARISALYYDLTPGGAT